MQTRAARAPGGTILGVLAGLALVPLILSLLDRPGVLACLALGVLVAAIALPGWARTGLLAGVATAALGTLAALAIAAVVLLALVDGLAAVVG